MKYTIKKVICTVIPFCLITGCTSVGNVLITPHPDSLRSANTEISFKDSVSEEACLNLKTLPGASSITAAAAAAGVAVAGVIKLLETEAKQYKASHSAAGSFDLETENCITFKLIYEDKETSDLVIYLDKSKDPALFLKVKKPNIKRVKSKIATWPLITALNGRNPWDGDSRSSKVGNTVGWINPLMILHAVYSIFDRDIYSVETQVKIKIDTIIEKDGQPSIVNVGSIELESEKHSIFDFKKIKLQDESYTTGYIPLPAGTKLPTNIVITIVEDNDFGNIVGKSAKHIGDGKDSIIGKFTD